MSKNIKAIEKFLVAEDKELQERIEFIKTQGKFLEEVLSPLGGHIQTTRFILSNFYRSAMHLPNLYKRGASREEDLNPREWPKLAQLRSVDQTMTQDKMKAACSSIFRDSDNFKLSDYAVIDFSKGHVIWQDMKFSLSHSIAIVEVEFGQSEWLDFPMDNKLNGIVYLRNDNGFPQGFLKAIGDDGNEFFFELSHFSILYLLDEDHRYADEGQPESDSEVRKANRDMGMFTLFDKRHKLLFVTTY